MGLTRIDYLFGAFAIVMAFAAKYLAVDTEFFVLMGTITAVKAASATKK